MPIEDQEPEIKQFVDNLARDAFGQTAQEATDKQLCIACNQPALAKCHTEAGIREYNISGMCEECYDALWEEED